MSSQPMSDLTTEVQMALQAFTDALRSDGYELQITEIAASAIHLKIEALEGACEDCLVPEHVMAPMIADSLPASMRSVAVHIKYPSEDNHR